VGSTDLNRDAHSMTQIAAEELGVPIENISVVTGDTETAPFSIPTVGSMITRSLAKAVSLACRDIKEQLCAHSASTGGKARCGRFVKGRVR